MEIIYLLFIVLLAAFFGFRTHSKSTGYFTHAFNVWL